MHIPTLTDIILQEQQKAPNAKGNLTLILTQIVDAAKIIASHANRTGLVDILGKTGNKNAYDEEVQKLDEFSNNLLVKTLFESNQVYAVASEELPDILYSPTKTGDYIVFFDPLDGSSNIDTNGPIGTIFSIYHKNDTVLQKGNKQIAAGYILYGPSTIFVYASQYSINGFTLDPSIGSFLLSFPNIKIPKKGNIYSINEGNYELFDEHTKKYLAHLKTTKSYKARYIGSMVADMHRTLLKGGIFLYPSDSKNKEGKLRLLFEVNPMAFLIEKAGGMAVSNGKNPLDILPIAVNHKVPIAIGSKENVEEFLKITND
ncbi:MAG: class 1 fructose-bisphosphatase [Candidatus Levyibacteriota bacterium]|nr:MAG: class 1 fructose-bisphosphatase [Candidatus Levybacteria bacterium]